MFNRLMKVNFIIGMVLCVLLIVLTTGCIKEREELPTKGQTSIIVDEAVSPVITVEKDTFEELYQKAKVRLKIAEARDAFVQFFNNESTKVIVTSRTLNREEREVAKRSNLTLSDYKVAVGAVAIIVHPDNPITQVRTTQLDSIFRGTITRWDELGWRHSPAKIGVNLPDQNSGVLETVRMKILHGDPVAIPANTVAGSLTMIQYVATHSTALGMVSNVWLREKHDSVNVLSLCDPAAPESLNISGRYFSPHQAYIYEHYYPLTQDIFIYSRSDMYNVGAGFISFVTSAAGQKIALGNGLVPATMPVRIVELSKRGL